MPSAFWIGQRVRLRTGGPEMTILNFGGDSGQLWVAAIWVEGNRAHRDRFPPEHLKPVE